MLKNKNVRLIFSLIIAVCLWLYVMGNVDPVITHHFSSVEVTMINEDELEELGLKATLESPKEVGVTIKGKRSEVNEAKKKGISAIVDVGNCDYGKNEEKIVVDLPEGSTATVQDITVEMATFNVE